LSTLAVVNPRAHERRKLLHEAPGDDGERVILVQSYDFTL